MRRVTKALWVLALCTELASVSAQGGHEGPAGGEGWSRFRGPNGHGVSSSTGLPVTFGEKENVVWRAAVPMGHSSPVVFGDAVYLTAAEGEKLLTIRLDRATGKEVWRAVSPRTRTTKVDGRNGPASPTAAVDRDVVVVFFPDFGMVAYGHDGKERWRLALGPFDNLYGMGASPVIHDGRVFLPCDQNRNSYLLAVDKATGKELWRVKRPWAKSGHCTPIFWTPKEGETQLVLPGSFYLDGYDPKTGERIWWVSGLSFEMKSTPVLHEGIVYINGYGSPLNNVGNQIVMPTFEESLRTQDANKDGFISKPEMPATRATGWFGFVDLDGDKKLGKAEWRYLRDALASKNGTLAIRAGGKGDMTEKNVIWTYHRSIPQLPSPLLYGGGLYMLNDQSGFITLLDPKTGKVIERGRLKEASDDYYASPVAADGKIYFVGLSGLITVLKKGGQLEPVAKVSKIGEGCYSTPAIVGNRIFIRTNDTLFCFGKKEGPGGR